MIALSLILAASNLTVAKLLLPYRAVEVFLAVLGSIICLIVARRPKHKPAFFLLGLAGLLLAVSLVRFHYFSYREQEVSFQSQGATLAGSLYLPYSNGPFPAMVIVHGSGRIPRFFYHYWADHWVRCGYVVLLYDKRGTGRSGGDYEGNNNTSRKNIELLAQDASAAFDLLRSRNEVLPEKAGFWGLSQAGWVVPRAAVVNGHAAFMLLVSGPAVSVGEENVYSDITGDAHRATSQMVAEAERKAAESLPRGYDPAPDLRQVNTPGLWLQGELDLSAPPHRSAQVIETFHAEGKPYEVHMFPGAGHLIFLPFRGLRPAELAPGFWEVQEEWLGKVISFAPPRAKTKARPFSKTSFGQSL